MKMDKAGLLAAHRSRGYQVCTSSCVQKFSGQCTLYPGPFLVDAGCWDDCLADRPRLLGFCGVSGLVWKYHFCLCHQVYFLLSPSPALQYLRLAGIGHPEAKSGKAYQRREMPCPPLTTPPAFNTHNSSRVKWFWQGR